MKINKDDFQPFIEHDMDQFLKTLNLDGEFGGNEAIVALARSLKVEIIIHQADQSAWNVDGTNDSDCEERHRQLHIAYHDWEHYSSVRRKSDNSNNPAWLATVGTNDKTEMKSVLSMEPATLNDQSQRPLTGKQKKKLRKEKAALRKKEKFKITSPKAQRTQGIEYFDSFNTSSSKQKL